MKSFLLFAALLSLPVLAADAELRVGPLTAADGTKTPARGGHEGQIITSDLSARYGEAGRLGTMYTVATAAAGYTTVAAGVSPIAAATTSVMLALFNPLTSGKNLEVVKVYANWISGTPGAGGLVFNYSCGNNVTTAQNAAPVNMSTGQAAGSVARGYSGTVTLTGSTAMSYMRPLSNCTPFAGAIAATTVGLNCLDEVEGAIVIFPGCMLALAPAAAGTSPIINGAIQYREAIP